MFCLQVERSNRQYWAERSLLLTVYSSSSLEWTNVTLTMRTGVIILPIRHVFVVYKHGLIST